MIKEIVSNKYVQQISAGVVFVVVGMVARTRTLEGLAVIERSIDKLDEDYVERTSDEIVDKYRNITN